MNRIESAGFWQEKLFYVYDIIIPPCCIQRASLVHGSILSYSSDFPKPLRVEWLLQWLSMKLYISGGRHCYPKTGERVKDVTSRYDDLDVVFIEYRETPASRKVRLGNWVLAPLLFAAVVGWAIFKRGCAALLGSDKEIADKLAAHYDAPMIRVDKSVHNIVREQRQLWASANWGLLAIPGLLIYVQPALIGFSILLAGYFSVILMATFVAGSMNDRNIEILRQIDLISAEKGYELGCIVTGGDHEKGLSTLVSLIDGVQIDE